MSQVILHRYFSNLNSRLISNPRVSVDLLHTYNLLDYWNQSSIVFLMSLTILGYEICDNFSEYPCWLHKIGILECAELVKQVTKVENG